MGISTFQYLRIQYMKTDSIKDGSVLRLGDLPTGTNVYNVELKAGDGGKLIRAGGNSARIMENKRCGDKHFSVSKNTKWNRHNNAG